MLRTNVEDLVEMAVAGFVSAPSVGRRVYRTDVDGTGRVSIGMAGIVYNARVGDSAYGWTGDHVEPGVSVSHPDTEVDYAMHYLTCVGNEALVTSGRAVGARGVVTGEHARLLVDFEEEVLTHLAVGDRITLKTHGRGMELLDCPRVLIKKAGPRLIREWGLEVSSDGRLRVPVVARMPSYILGSGSELIPDFVDHDMMSADRAALAELGLDALRLGDLVAVMDTDHRYGRGYGRGVSIGLIMHGDSFMGGHGPGCQEMLVCAGDEIEPVIDADANIAEILGIRSLEAVERDDSKEGPNA